MENHNYKFILRTLYSSIKYINNTDLLPSISLYVDRDTETCKLDRFYKITDSKCICFDVSRIQHMLDEASETIYTQKYDKLRTLILKFVLSIVLEEYIIDKSKYSSQEEIRESCYVYATKFLSNNFSKAKRIVGSIDITNDADTILSKVNFYKIN